MNKKTTAVIAGAAGSLLLLGGGTFALWSDSAEVPETAITAGNLDVIIGGPQWFDMSTDRTDEGHSIPSIDSFRIIPGDTVEARFPVTADLQGDNMLANLRFDLNGSAAVSGPLAAGIHQINYTVLDASGNHVGAPNANDLNVVFASADNTNTPDGTEALINGDEYTVVVSLTFNSNTANQTHITQTADILNTAELQLNQVRTGDGFE